MSEKPVVHIHAYDPTLLEEDGETPQQIDIEEVGWDVQGPWLDEDEEANWPEHYEQIFFEYKGVSFEVRLPLGTIRFENEEEWPNPNPYAQIVDEQIERGQ